MKKVVLGVVLLFFVIMAAGCARTGKYSDVKAVSNDFAGALEECVAALEKAENADAVAAAFDNLAAAAEKIGPRMQEINAKYPELQELDEPPAELREVQARFDNVGSRFGQALMQATMQYGMDPKVEAAADRMDAAMELFQ